MNRTLRGAWSRRSSLATLSAMTAVVVAGVVVTVGFAEHAGTSRMVAGPLLLLGLVAVPAVGSELASVRREEIGVTRLRGQYGDDLVRHLAAEPALVIAAGAVLGAAAGVAALAAVTRVELGDARWWPGLPALAGVVVVLAGTLLAVLLGMAWVVREPLARQVAIAERRRGTTTLGLFGALLVMVAAAVVGYRAGVTAGDPDGLVLLGPAVVGLAAGQAAVWLLALVTRVGVSATEQRSLASYVAFRRLRGSGGLSGAVRLLVAALVVGTVALSGARNVADWTDRTARLDTVGAQLIAVDLAAPQTLALTHEVDPDGRYLMAVAWANGRTPEERRAYLDASRFDRVAGDGLDGTAAAELAGWLPSVQGPELAFARGDLASVTVSGAPEEPGMQRPRLRVGLVYIADDGFEQTVTLPVPVGPPGRLSTVDATVAGCRLGCLPVRITLETDDGAQAAPPLLVTRLTLGDLDVLDADWVQTDDVADQERTISSAAGLHLQPLPDGPVTLERPVDDVGLPVLATRGLRVHRVLTLGGRERGGEVVGRFAALPFVQADGTLGDLAPALVGDLPVVPYGEVAVVARADTPPDVLAQVAAHGRPVSLGETRRGITHDTGALQGIAFALLSSGCLAVALLALAAAVAGQRPTYRREVAALRVVGVSLDVQRRACWYELALVGAVTVGCGLAGGLVAGRLLLPVLPILDPPASAIPLDTSVAPVAALAAAVTTAAGFLLLGRAGRRVDADQSRPATLREEEG